MPQPKILRLLMLKLRQAIPFSWSLFYMQRYRTRNKIIYIGTMLVLVVVSFVLLTHKEAPSVNTDTNLDSQEVTNNIVNTGSAPCRNQSSVEYLKYKSLPEDQIRNNKFGIYIYAE